MANMLQSSPSMRGNGQRSVRINDKLVDTPGKSGTTPGQPWFLLYPMQPLVGQNGLLSPNGWTFYTNVRHPCTSILDQESLLILSSVLRLSTTKMAVNHSHLLRSGTWAHYNTINGMTSPYTLNGLMIHLLAL